MNNYTNILYEPIVFKDKDAAWFVYKDVRDQLRSQNKPLHYVKINGSTVSADVSLVDIVRGLAKKCHCKLRK